MKFIRFIIMTLFMAVLVSQVTDPDLVADLYAVHASGHLPQKGSTGPSSPNLEQGCLHHDAVDLILEDSVSQETIVHVFCQPDLDEAIRSLDTNIWQPPKISFSA
jgi:hypothetical protein